MILASASGGCLSRMFLLIILDFLDLCVCRFRHMEGVYKISVDIISFLILACQKYFRKLFKFFLGEDEQDLSAILHDSVVERLWH